MKPKKVHWKINAPGRPAVAACSWNVSSPLTTKKRAVTCKTCQRYVDR